MTLPDSERFSGDYSFLREDVRGQLWADPGPPPMRDLVKSWSLVNRAREEYERLCIEVPRTVKGLDDDLMRTVAAIQTLDAMKTRTTDQADDSGILRAERLTPLALDHARRTARVRDVVLRDLQRLHMESRRTGWSYCKVFSPIRSRLEADVNYLQSFLSTLPRML
jgi:hypothetical protein